MNSVIVIGSTSMLGREVIKQLTAKGISVIKAGRDHNNDIAVELGSGRAPEFVRPCKADVVIFCASSFCNDSYEGVIENLRVNLSGCIEALQIYRQSSALRMIYAGTVSSNPDFEQHAIGAYGFSKAEAERVLQWSLEQIGGQFCSLRFSQLWDTEGFCCKHQQWFGRIIAYASRGLVLKMPPSHGNRNFLHVSDAAQLLVRAAESDLEGIHAASYPEDIDLYHVAREAYKIFSNGGDVVIDNSKLPFRAVNFPKEKEIYDYLNFYPEISLPYGIQMIRDAGTADNFGPMDVQ